MPAFDHAQLDRLVGSLLERLEGDWLLVGGALVALWLEPRRVTEDIDLIGLGGSQGERLALMQAASDLSLPIESVNSAADFFVKRIEGWQGEIELFRSGPRARFYRPSPTLFLLLKVGRLSEQDLADCLALLRRGRIEGWPIERGRVAAALEANPGLDSVRRATLREALDA